MTTIAPTPLFGLAEFARQAAPLLAGLEAIHSLSQARTHLNGTVWHIYHRQAGDPELPQHHLVRARDCARALPKAAKSLGVANGNWWATAAFFAGIVLILLIDRLIPSAENPHEVRTSGQISAVHGVAGIMVYISLDELLPTSRAYGKSHDSLYGLLAGMVVMAMSLLLLLRR